MNHDYIVVGAGSAGVVLARRLVDAGHRVLLLEAGPADSNPAIHDPTRSIELWGSDVDWAFTTEPQTYADGRRLPWPRGKTLGGSSAFNGMIYVRGVPADYDAWAFQGAAGWSWPGVEPYFRKLEHFGDASAGRGTDGPLYVQRNPGPDPLVQAWVLAAQEYGLPFNDDYNSGDSTGVSYTQHTIRDGKRQSTWVGYGKPIQDDPGLTVVTGAQTTRVLFDEDRAIGVEYLRDGQLNTAYAESEIILSAGVFGSPQLLMLSGVGPAEQLRSLGLRVRVDLPGIGQNLQDHWSSPLIWHSKQESPAWAAQGLEAHFFSTTINGLIAPDVQPIFLSWVYPLPNVELPRQGFSAVAQILHPYSRGELRLRSADPTVAPILDPRVFADPRDLETLVDNLEMLRDIATQDALREWTDGEAIPGAAVRTREQLRDHARATVVSGHHQVGTAKMGLDAHSVVDPELRVHGLLGLRVVDASVMPTLPSANTNGPTVMIAEKAADLILGRKVPA
ncbi:GMC family oxidoreductase [Nocardia altamirensis]|uniref:GMC family oxidoreductase n=1 Tax=Nocardia altamirensis TaxID=472158 RepID=UPI000A428C51|nr:GMC family oxidoreductase N-terminal domain-containing protein [Nocardia altamirensis]